MYCTTYILLLSMLLEKEWERLNYPNVINFVYRLKSKREEKNTV